MEKLLIKLNKLWNSSDDIRFKGENPACIDVLDSIEKEFKKMTDNEIKTVIDNLPKGQIEQLLPVLEDMVDEYEFMKNYI